MNERDVPSPLAAREELEDCWRGRLEEAKESYLLATRRYEQLREGAAGVPTENSALLLARNEQFEARAELQRILRIFTELTVHGRMPEGESAKRASGAAQWSRRL